jgi:alcohol-forming fatty acyl-CoA reductase
MENYESATQLSEIQSFYNDTTIFLTGATGFMGNLILDKLIR